MPKHNHPLKALAGSTYGGNSVPITNYKVFMFWQDYNEWIVGQEKAVMRLIIICPHIKLAMLGEEQTKMLKNK